MQPIKLQKITVLFGSPHKNGHTEKLLKHFLSGFNGTDINIINAYQQNIHPCIDCGMCSKKRFCQFEDMKKIDILLKNCDILIIASPVYNSSFPSPLKAIFDRTQVYYRAKTIHNENAFENHIKKALILLTQGSHKSCEQIIKNQTEYLLNLLGAEEHCFYTICGSDDTNFDIDKICLKDKNKIKNIIDKLNNNQS